MIAGTCVDRSGPFGPDSQNPPLFDSGATWNVDLISKKQPNSSSIVASMLEVVDVSCPKWPIPKHSNRGDEL